MRFDIHIHHEPGADLLLTLKDIRDHLSRIEAKGNQIMSAVSDFVAKQNAFNDRQDVAIDGLRGDVKTLNDTIEKLQNTPGPISAEDQASLDALEVRGDAISAKLEALDAMTAPTPPTA